MKTKPWITLGLLLAGSAFAAAQDPPAEPPARPQRQMPPGMMEKFDTDGDGKLSPDEMKAMQAQRQAQRAEMIKKYDADGDGKLSQEERQKMFADMRARHEELVKKYDANENGKLDPEEYKAAKEAGEDFPIMGRPGRGPGQGRPGGKGGADGPPPAPEPAPAPAAGE